MGLRILPFRQYDENDVINLFAAKSGQEVDQLGEALSTNKAHGGVFVQVEVGDLNNDPIEYGADSYLGKTDYPHIGANQYPTVPHKVELADGSSKVLGITLNQVAKADENGEKLLYYPQKALENHAVLPGQAVPVARKGIFTFHESAFDIADWGTDAAIGNTLLVTSNGQVSGQAAADVSGVGTVLATGSRSEPLGSLSGNYAICAIDC